MKGFSIDEFDYIEELIKRNFRENPPDWSIPLEKPMSARERKLRSRIRKKVAMFVEELARAQLAGLAPTPEMKEAKMGSLMDVFDQLITRYTLLEVKKSHDRAKHSQDSVQMV